MNIPPRRAMVCRRLILAALGALLIPVRSGTAQAGDQFPFLAAVTEENVYVRCGAAPSYYPFGTVKRDDLVRVIGQKYYQNTAQNLPNFLERVNRLDLR